MTRPSHALNNAHALWHCEEQGRGRPLILLHGIGMSSFAWQPIMAILSKERRVLAFDTAGFGQTPPLGNGIPPTVPNLVAALKQTLHAMGIHEPFDVAGNSMGGWMALEMAKQGLSRSTVAISPAGLWQGHPSILIKYLFQFMRWATKLSPKATRWAMKFALMRELFMAVPISIGSTRMTPDEAFRAATEFAYAPGFDATIANAGAFEGGQQITTPLTVAFGTRDWLLRANSQHRNELPRHTKWLRPAKWGHVPMWVDPQGVAKLILDETR
jgi:pimeloyl-ACP methyl ester carboxylesterase